MSAQCVFCGVSSDLNTTMTVSLEDGTKPTVYVCDQHAEEATVKRCREAFLDKQKQIDAVLAQAKALGLELSQAGSGLTVARSAAPAAALRQVPVLPVPPMPLLDQSEEDLVDTAVLDRPMVSTGGQAGAYAVKGMASHDMRSLESKLPEGMSRQGKARMQVIEGRAGMPVAIPTLRQDGIGITRIRVTKSTDNNLQARFKDMAYQSRWDQGADFRNGYDHASERTCTMCAGSGSVLVGRNRSQICPKCGGSCII